MTFKTIRRLLLCSAAALLLCPANLAAAEPAPVKLAVFDFELEDFSAGAQVTGESEMDTAQLKRAADDVRRLLAESGRYVLVDASGTDAPAAKERRLRQCGGCDAGIAAQLGAEQSLTGVITRIGRTEYTARFVIRDARTGAVAGEQRTDLRMGANYSWNRGAAWLARRWLQEGSQQAASAVPHTVP